MAATLQRSISFSSQELKFAVLSFEKSRVLLRKLILTSMASIMYQRVDFHRNDFSVGKHNDVTFYNFRKNAKSPQIQEMYRSKEGIFDAFDKNYLRELYLFFTLKKEPTKILESYKFIFTYVTLEKQFSDTEAQAMRQDLRENVKQLLKSIESLNSQPVLKNREIIPQICTTYFDNITPLEYVPPGFSQTGGNKFDNFKNLSLSSESNTFVGLLNTGFHIIKYQKFENEIVVDNSELVDNSAIQIQQNLALETEAIIELSSNDESNEQAKIRCFCSINKSLTSISFVQCSICLNLEHTPCIQHLYVRDVKLPHCCEYCKFSISTSSTPTDVNRRYGMCIFRLALCYMYFNKTLPTEVLENIDEIWRNRILKMLSNFKLIEHSVNGYVINEEVFNESIGSLLHSMGLNENTRLPVEKNKEDLSRPAKKYKSS